MSKFFKALQQAEQERALQASSERHREWPEPLTPDSQRTAVHDTRDARFRYAAGLAHEDGLATSGPSEVTVERVVPEPTFCSVEGIDEHLVSLLKPASFEAAQYRTLAHVVERLRETVKVVGIASPSGGDGKTITAINLAGALAQDARSRVLLVEADLRGPMIGRYLGIPDTDRGLARSIARPELSLMHAVIKLPGVHLDVLPAGHPSGTPYEALRSARVEELLAEARRAYDYVVVDMPPLVAVPEGRVIERLVDRVLVVVRAHHTSRTLLDEALNLTDRERVIGLVFNGDDRLVSRFGRYYRHAERFLSRNGHRG
jgi:protein-tyrosine kinase